MSNVVPKTCCKRNIDALIAIVKVIYVKSYEHNSLVLLNQNKYVAPAQKLLYLHLYTYYIGNPPLLAFYFYFDNVTKIILVPKYDSSNL